MVLAGRGHQFQNIDLLRFRAFDVAMVSRRRHFNSEIHLPDDRSASALEVRVGFIESLKCITRRCFEKIPAIPDVNDCSDPPR